MVRVGRLMAGSSGDRGGERDEVNGRFCHHTRRTVGHSRARPLHAIGTAARPRTAPPAVQLWPRGKGDPVLGVAMTAVMICDAGMRIRNVLSASLSPNLLLEISQ